MLNLILALSFLCSTLAAQLGPWVTPATVAHSCQGTSFVGLADTLSHFNPDLNPNCGCVTAPVPALIITCFTEPTVPPAATPCAQQPRWGTTMTVSTQVDTAVAPTVSVFFGMWFEPLGATHWPTQVPVPGAFPTANIAFPSPGYSVSLRNATMSAPVLFGWTAIGANIVFPAYNPAWNPILPVRVQSMLVNANGDLVFGQAFYTEVIQ